MKPFDEQYGSEIQIHVNNNHILSDYMYIVNAIPFSLYSCNTRVWCLCLYFFVGQIIFQYFPLKIIPKAFFRSLKKKKKDYLEHRKELTSNITLMKKNVMTDTIGVPCYPSEVPGWWVMWQEDDLHSSTWTVNMSINQGFISLQSSYQANKKVIHPTNIFL